MRSALLASLCFFAVAASGTRAYGAEPQQAQGDAAGSPSTPPPAIPSGLTPARVMVAGRLDFTIAPDVTTCPVEDKLHIEVARRIGYDPFAKGAEGPPFGSVRVAIKRSPVGLLATYEYEDAAGVHEWTRTVEARGADRSACERLFSALGALLAVELTIYARHVPPPAPTEPPAPSPPVQLDPAPPHVQLDPAPVQAPAVAVPPMGLRVRGEAGGSVFGTFGMAPAPTVGGALHLGVALVPPGRWWFTAAAEARADAPTAYRSDEVSIGLLALSALACVHLDASAADGVLGFPFACAVGTWGRLRAAVDNAAVGAASVGTRYAGVGARVGFELRPAPFVALVAQAELRGAAVPGFLVLAQGREAWRMPDVSGDAGIGAMFVFDIARR